MTAVPPPIAEVIISALAEAITGEGHVTAIPGPPMAPSQATRPGAATPDRA